MANKGVRWMLRWVFDKESRRRVEQEGKETAKKVGRTFEGEAREATKKQEGFFKRSFSSIKSAGQTAAKGFQRAWNGALGALRSPIGRMAGALGAMLSIGAMARFGQKTVQVATEADAIWTRLDGTLRTTGTTLAANRAEIDRVARAMQDATVVGDEDFADTLQRIIAITGDYRLSLVNVQLAADLAAGAQIDLQTAAMLVGRVLTGDSAMLKRYGIVIEEGANAVQVLRERFGGMAANEARSFRGQITQLTNEIGDFQQAIGDAIIEGGEGASVIEILTEKFKQGAIWVDSNREEVASWVATILTVGDAAVKFGGLVLKVFGGIVRATELAAIQFKFSWESRVAEVRETFGVLASVVGRLLRNEKLQDWGEEQRQRAAMDLQAWRAWVEEETGGAAKAMEDMASRMRAAASSAADALPPGGGGVPELLTRRERGVLGQTVGRRAAPELADILPVGPDMNAGLEAIAGRDHPWRVALEESLEAIRERSQNVAESMADSFSMAFQAIRGGADVFPSLAHAAAGVGEAIIGELMSGQAEYHMAQAAGKLAEGLWPPNPAALASAAQHAAAAGLFRSLGSLVTGGGGRPGFAAGGLGGGFDVDRGRFGTFEPRGPEIHFYVDPFDPSNPVHQEQVGAAVAQATERFGASKITVHPRATG